MTSSQYSLTMPLDITAHFSFVEVFREATEYTRIYNLPFNSIAVCTRNNPDNPSIAEELETGKIYTYQENDICFMTCNMANRYHYTTDNEHLCIHFKLELFPGADVFAGIRSRRVFNSPEMRRECEALFHEENPIRRLAGCQEFALRICRLYWPEKYAFDVEQIRVFEPVLHFVRRKISARLTVAVLARMMNRSEGYFTRSFRDTFNMSPKEYIQEELFSRAAQLLADPKMNVKMTAAALDFSSEFYFSKFFKRISGISPHEYGMRTRNIINVRK